MKQLPISEIYEQELEYFPYKLSLERVVREIKERAPENGSLIDLMCGPGYLLGKIAEARSDLSLTGMDIDSRYIDFARQKYPHVGFEQGDVLTWQPGEQADVVICTGALHHIPYEKQEEVIAKMAKMMKPTGFGILSDCYVDFYENEEERKLAAADLGYKYLMEAIKNKAPDEVVSAAIDILHNDVMKQEFKTHIYRRLGSVVKFFDEIKRENIWPDWRRENCNSVYGDYIFVLKPKE